MICSARSVNALSYTGIRPGSDFRGLVSASSSKPASSLSIRGWGGMWRRSGRGGGFPATGSTAAAFQREASCGIHPPPLPSPQVQVLLRHHLRQPTPPSALYSFLRLSSLVYAPPSDTGTARGMLWRSGCSHSYSSGEFPKNDVGGGAATCWNCGAFPSSPFLVCGACRSVQPVDASVDYFRIFGREKGYELTTDDLESKYKEWQKKLHPDIVHTKSEQERSYAAEQSARVIDAYRTLSKPLSRALYLLKLEGMHVDEEKTISDPELLSEVMEIREAVEEANESKALELIKSELQEKLQSWSDSFGEAFKDRKFEDAVTSIQRMTYYERAIQEIVKKL